MLNRYMREKKMTFTLTRLLMLTPILCSSLELRKDEEEEVLVLKQ